MNETSDIVLILLSATIGAVIATAFVAPLAYWRGRASWLNRYAKQKKGKGL
jgi:hypothetical protein